MLTIPQQVREIACAYCKVHAKQLFTTRKKARRARHIMCSPGLNVYRCNVLRGYHIGHLPPEVTSGDVDRRAYFNHYHGNVAS